MGTQTGGRKLALQIVVDATQHWLKEIAERSPAYNLDSQRSRPNTCDFCCLQDENEAATRMPNVMKMIDRRIDLSRVDQKQHDGVLKAMKLSERYRRLATRIVEEQRQKELDLQPQIPGGGHLIYRASQANSVLAS